jgi:hypothetical protein
VMDVGWVGHRDLKEEKREEGRAGEGAERGDGSLPLLPPDPSPSSLAKQLNFKKNPQNYLA